MDTSNLIAELDRKIAHSTSLTALHRSLAKRARNSGERATQMAITDQLLAETASLLEARALLAKHA